MLRIIKDGKNGFYKSASGRRDKLEIMLDLLVISRQPIKKTHMLYNANLNFDQLERYLDMLQNMGLLEPVQTPFKGYKITNKGEIFVGSLILSEPSNVLVSNQGDRRMLMSVTFVEKEERKMKIVSRCDCEFDKCKTAGNNRNAHFGEKCLHPFGLDHII